LASKPAESGLLADTDARGAVANLAMLEWLMRFLDLSECCFIMRSFHF
jgi:hypothetical protein